MRGNMLALLATAILGGPAPADDTIAQAVDIGPGLGAGHPDPVASPDGTKLWVAFGSERDGQGDVYVARSEDGGNTFAPPVKAIDAGGRYRVGCQRGPRIGLDAAGNVYVSACVQVEAITPAPKYPQPDCWLAVSRDGGRTFGAPVKVNDGGKTATEGMHAMAIAGDGTAHLVWLDTRGAKRGNQLWYAQVTGRGTKVVGNALAYAAPGGTICPCCAPALALDGKGSPVAAFRNAEGGARDAWVAISRDRGRTFAAAKVGAGTWKAST